MEIPERKTLLALYESDISKAYDDLLKAFLDYLADGVGDLRSMAGRCGAQCSAAHKRCKRGLVFAALASAQAEGLDITPTVAEHLCSRLLGRGVDFRAALSSFGTPGRTAANKSATGAADLATLETALSPEIFSLLVAMDGIRDRYRGQYDERAKDAAQAAGKLAAQQAKQTRR
ncbi:hypothetical protein [Pseudomonas eucalypticola]|uniref:Uncharacterized protein n=1 Tax=Pseudomonas eucalypticola TaxID=2599595 RepID=A0A7D5H505_9PSED|nr:hypothetical protein [Pseudomonas eucalypticola]QKZ07845.1 hypothetical protein HWQ56_28885 [Pseudomonas eucalypticola]